MFPEQHREDAQCNFAAGKNLSFGLIPYGLGFDEFLFFPEPSLVSHWEHFRTRMRIDRMRKIWGVGSRP